MLINDRRRLISIEILRSAVIVYFLFFGSFELLTPAFYRDVTGFLTLEQKLLALPFFLGSGVKGAFVFMFSISVSWSVTRRIRQGFRRIRILRDSTHIVVLFIILDLFRAYFLAGLDPLPFSGGGGGSMVSLFLQSGILIFPPAEQLFHAGFLLIAGLTTLFSIGLIMLLTWLGEKVQVYVLVVLTFIGTTWLLFMGGEATPFYDESRILFEKGGFSSFLSFLLFLFGGRSFSVITVAPFSIFGAVFGYQLATVRTRKDFYYSNLFFVLLLTGLFIFLGGTDFIAAQLVSGAGLIDSFFMQHNIRILILFCLLILIGITTPLVGFFDLHKGAAVDRATRITRVPRQCGRVVLSLLMVEAAMNELFTGLKEDRLAMFHNSPFPFFEEPLSTVVFLTIVTVFWLFFLFLWRLTGFFGGVEYLVRNLILLFRKNGKPGWLSRGEMLRDADRLIFYFDADL